MKCASYRPNPSTATSKYLEQQNDHSGVRVPNLDGPHLLWKIRGKPQCCLDFIGVLRDAFTEDSDV